MQHKQTLFNFKGMFNDLSPLNTTAEHAFKIKNMRFITDKPSSLLSLTNEKGNKKVDLDSNILGVPIGQSSIDNTIILFTTTETESLNKDTIYKINLQNNEVSTLFSGNLNFSVEHPLEILLNYENEDNIKLYWVDGINPFRVINIKAAEENMSKWNNDSFNAVPTINFVENVTITKNYYGGTFSPGTIQYAFTYFNIYGQESNIFYISDLYYTSFADRGGSPEETVSNSFTLNIKNSDNKFDFIRIYSIHRTSLDATPSVKVVADIQNNNNILYTDTNTNGYTVDPTTLLYLGGESIIANTLSQKDNTLFLGNFSIEKLHINNEIKEFFKSDGALISITNGELSFIDNKELPIPNNKSYYSYENQLKYSSRKIKTFKYLETYRFGVQFQHKTGKWSEPLWIEDCRINLPINNSYLSEDPANLILPYCKINNINIIKDLVDSNYIKARPVIVYPTEEERECVCQGILCPTVYNASDRLDNFPFTQSSWFIRPSVPFDYKITNQYGEIGGEKIKDWRSFENPNGEILDTETSRSEYSRAGVLNTLNGTFTTDKEITLPNGTNMHFSIKINNIDKGSVLEFRHNEAVPANTKRNAEIQCIDSNTGETNAYTNEDKESYKRKYKNLFYVDQSIITLHSPDIEFGNINNSLLSNSKLRIIGYVPLTAFISDISVTTDNSTQTYTDWNGEVIDSRYPQTNNGNGLYYRKTGVLNTFTYPEGNSWSKYGDSYFGYRSLASTASWVDGLYRPIDLDDDEYNARYNYRGMFVLYPWHKIGSLNDTPDSAENKSSVLKRKVMSNLKYSYKTQYFNNTDIWESYIKGDKNKTGISGAVLFNSNEDSIVKIPAPLGSNREDIVYKGNVDKILTSDYEYDLVATRVAKMREYLNLEEDYYKEYKPLTELTDPETDQFFHGTQKSKQPIEMKYKSTPHIVMALNYTEDDYKNVILPTIMDGDSTASWEVNKINPDYSTVGYPFWEQNKESEGVYQDVITSNKLKGIFPEFGGIQHGFLWLGELYRDNIENRFGGTTEEAFENNKWLPAGDSVSLIDFLGNPINSLTLKWTEGDTYYQRYDHLKTYPFTQEDSNSIVEIVSFMCETRVNLDGRYDRNRGLQDNLNISPQNFNLMNSAYSQQDNIFVYRGLNTNKQILNNFPTTITWTKTKTAGEIVDTWTNITLASTLDFDGSKGSINAIRKYNNNLIVFQDDALAELMYNSNAQIASTVGVPIEIANSGKIDGKRYFAEIGCTNKGSICTSPQGLYFVSKYNKDIYCYADKLYNLSSTLYFDTWVNNTYKGVNTWDPYNFNNIVSYYDANNSDILFITKDECLAYSEKLGKFSSFYSYEYTPYFINVGNKVITVKYNSGTCELWEQNAGEYNSFFDNYKPFGITFISNGESSNDKIFNTLDLRAEVFSNEEDVFKEPFDILNTWNSYQEGTSNLKDIKGFPSNIKKKFRIWRVNVPRDNSNGRDRMRNPWLYLELLKQTPNTDKTVLHNITVNYFE